MLVILGIAAPLIAAGYASIGAGGFKRLVTLSGVYPVCKPGGYDVVCFLDADSKSGGLACLPLSAASPNGECRR